MRRMRFGTPVVQYLVDDQPAVSGAGPAAAGASPNLKAWWQRGAKWTRRWRNATTQAGDLWWLTRVQWFLLAVLAVWVAVDVVTPRHAPIPDVISGATATGDSGTVLALAQDMPTKTLGQYLDGFQRNPFTGLAALVAQPVTETPSAQSQLQTIAAGLKVVGVSRGPRPEVLLEDTAHNQTHIVKAGDQVVGVDVVAISPDGVVTLGLDGETAEVR